MRTLEFFTSPHSFHLLGLTVSLGPNGLLTAIGWALFATGTLMAVRERVTGVAAPLLLPPLVSAALTLATMSAGLGLLLNESYPSFARVFCFPYALLALAVAVLGHAMRAGERPVDEK
jgi:hypothetical protein